MKNVAMCLLVLCIFFEICVGVYTTSYMLKNAVLFTFNPVLTLRVCLYVCDIGFAGSIRGLPLLSKLSSGHWCLRTFFFPPIIKLLLKYTVLIEYVTY